MKTRTLVSILILVLAVLIIAGSCATTKKAISEEDFFETWSGMWADTEYSGTHKRLLKRINHSNGTWEWYYDITGTIPNAKGISTILDHWIDSKGDIWYKASWESTPGSVFAVIPNGYEMGKISNSGNTWELIFTLGESPIEEWNPDDIRYTYRVYTRQ